MKDPVKIILAEINGTPELQVRQAIKLKKYCEALGLEHPVNVNSVEELIDVMGENKGSPVLLFSNFPPNSSYPSSSWEADYYSISQKLFTALEKRYTFKAIHFITGAHELMLGDAQIRSLFSKTPLTITRKKEWINAEADYQEQYRRYVEGKINEACLNKD